MIANQEALKAQERKCSPFTVRAYENYHSEAFLLQEKNSYPEIQPCTSQVLAKEQRNVASNIYLFLPQ